MRWSWMLAGALVLAGCGQETPAPEAAGAEPAYDSEGYDNTAADSRPERPARPPLDLTALSGYDEGWALKAGWPGEYPPGFAVLDADVRVPARARPNPTDPQDVSCLLPQYANYHLWNEDRVDADNLEFFVATKKFPVTVLENADVEFVANSDIETLTVQAGDQLTYVGYLGEGFMVLDFDGQEFQINESELREISDIGAIENQEHLWVRVACLAGPQAWLIFDEAIVEEGVYPSPMTRIRQAEDVYPEDVENIRAMMAPEMFAIPPGESVIIPPSPE